MNAISSPLNSAQLERPAPSRYLRWGLIGRLAWWCKQPPKWQAYFQSLKRQVNERGPLPEDVWQTPLRRKIANDIETILSDVCWGERLSFHPDDPWLVIGECEVGDLSELEAIMKIEKKFGVELNTKDIFKRIAVGLTFSELVAIIEERGTQLTM